MGNRRKEVFIYLFVFNSKKHIKKIGAEDTRTQGTTNETGRKLSKTAHKQEEAVEVQPAPADLMLHQMPRQYEGESREIPSEYKG